MQQVQSSEARAKASLAKAAARQMAVLASDVKDRALHAMADALEANKARILEANALDVDQAKARGITGALIDRLTLNEQRVRDMAEGLRQVAALPDPVGEVLRGWVRPNGMRVSKVRVPLGVVAIIYESRPNVTSDAAALCVKSGNAAFLRGSSTAIHSNTAIAAVLREGQTIELRVQETDAVNRRIVLSVTEMPEPPVRKAEPEGEAAPVGAEDAEEADAGMASEEESADA